MLKDKRILAVVPARSGSKGIPHKNMRKLKGISLIGWAGLTLGRVSLLDAGIISTDSDEYIKEAQKYGLDAPFIRPDHLSNDRAGAIETMQHALIESEKFYSSRFDIVLIIEPTSPLRTPQDIEQSVRMLIETGADSVVAVSPLSPKSHPRKILKVAGNRLDFFMPEGNEIKSRQALEGSYYWRNGICYALTRDCLMQKGLIFTKFTLPQVIPRPVVNIDEPIELDWAEFLMNKYENLFPVKKNYKKEDHDS